MNSVAELFISFSFSYCNGCMLDPDCGLCYKLNKSSVVESSCIPVDKDSTMKAAWGRYVTFQNFLVLCSTGCVLYAVKNTFAVT